MKKKNDVVFLYVPWVFDQLGGVDVVVNNLFFGLNEQGINVRIAEQLWGRRREWTDEVGRSFVTINFFIPKLKVGFVRGLKNITSFFFHGMATLWNLQSSGVTVVNAHFPTKGLFMLCLLKYFRFWNGRVILSFHGADVDDVQPDDKVWEFIFNISNGISVCSHALKEKLQQKMSKNCFSIDVVHNGIDSSIFNNLDEIPAYNFTSEVSGDYIVCLANFVEHKGQGYLIEAFYEIYLKYPNLTLVLAGGRDNGEWVKFIDKLCIDLQIRDRVEFVFDVPYEYVPSLLKGANALVLPSKYESFGLVIGEAGLAETPVVAFDVGGIPEIVPSSEYGCLVPLGDVGALTKAIEKTILSPAESKITAVNLRKRIINEFSCETMCDHYLSLFQM